MPSRRANVSDGRAEDEARKRRRLMREYNIKFCGPGTSKWPSTYESVFREIRQIGRLEFATYETNGRADDGLQARAQELARKAADDYADRVNERTLQFHTESRVFDRLNTELKCQKCRKRMSGSETRAIGLRGLPSCHCAPEERDWNNYDDTGETGLFSNVGDQEVVPDPQDRLQERGLPGQRPDGVHGLRLTATFRRGTSIMNDLTHAPFRSIEQPLYPFLVIEAKSGGKTIGFEGIEAQSAFPLRTCLMLQERLRRASGVDLDPLVWFMPYQGDIWRVSACVVEGNEMNVYDLWQGRTRCRDGALQLLLIVDYIHAWAKGFRKNILRCLQGGPKKLCRFSPAASSQYSSIQGSLSLRRTPSMIAQYVPATPQVETIIDESMGDSDDQAAEEVTTATSPRETFDTTLTRQNGALVADQRPPRGSVHPLLRWAQCPRNQTSWSPNATIRHADMVRFSFERFSILEGEGDASLLEESFYDVSQPWRSCRMDKNLIRDLTQVWPTLIVTTRQISELKSLWLKVHHETMQDEEVRVPVVFLFDSFFDKRDWHVVRRICCVSFHPTQPAVYGGSGQAQDSDFSDKYLELKDAFVAVQSLTEHTGLAAAASARQLALVPADGRLSWRKGPELLGNLIEEPQRPPGDQTEASSSLSPASSSIFIAQTGPIKVLPKPMLENLAGLFPTGDFDVAHKAIMFERNSRWSEATQRYCLMVMDETDFTNAGQLGRKITAIEQQGDVYALCDRRDDGDGYQRTYRRDDLEGESDFLSQWAHAIWTRGLEM